MLVDSSFIIALMRESNHAESGPATRKLKQLGNTGISLPLFVLCELEAGALGSSHPEENRLRISRLTEMLPIEYPTEGFSTMYAKLDNDLRRSGKPIPVMDLLIATLARCLNTPLLTSDYEHFSRVPSLQVVIF